MTGRRDSVWGESLRDRGFVEEKEYRTLCEGQGYRERFIHGDGVWRSCTMREG